MNRNSVRKSPTPSPSNSSTFSASSGLPMLQTSSYSVPSALTVRRPRNFSSSAFSFRNFSRFSVYSLRTASFGSAITMPDPPSTITGWPSLSIDVASATLKTAGISRARARIAECEVLPPVSVMMPTILPFLMPAVTEGVSSLVRRTVPFGASETLISRIPRSFLRRPALISRTSAARWRIISSSIEEKMPMNMSHMVS